MTQGKLLDNDTQLFIFISILIMTQLHPRDPENRQQILGTALLGKKQLQPVEWVYNWALSANNAQFVSVDLIGEKNKVILEFTVYICKCIFQYLQKRTSGLLV